jgi:O-antigen/teichoic acid export membrane protein
MAGMPSAAIYYCAAGRAAARAFIAVVRPYFLLLTVVGCVVAGVFTYLGAGLLHLSEPVYETVLITYGVGLFMWNFLMNAGLQGEHRFHQLAVARPITPILYLICVIVLYLRGEAPSPATVMMLLLLAWTVGTIVVALLVWWPRMRPSGEGTLPSATEARAFGTRASVAAAMPVDGLSIDQLALGVLSTHGQLGLYTIGYGFESLPVLVLIAMSQVAGPNVAAAVGDQRKALARRWLVIGLGISFLACGFAEAIVDPVLPMAFGSGADGAMPIARILIFAGLFLGLRRVGAAVLQGVGQPGRSTQAEAIGVVVLLVGLGLVSGKYGAAGAAWALGLAGAVTVVAQLVFLRRAQPAFVPSALSVEVEGRPVAG